MIDSIKVLHDYLYLSPDAPVAYSGDVVTRDYAATDVCPAAHVETEASGLATLVITVGPDQLADVLAVSSDNLVSDLGYDPQEEGSLAKARAKYGPENYDHRLSVVTRTFFLTAVILRTRLFPLATPKSLTRDVIELGKNPAEGQDYTFAYTFPILPKGELTSYDAVEIEVPRQLATNAAMVAARLDATIAARERQTGKAIDPDGPEAAELRTQVTEELDRDMQNRWSGEVIDRCVAALEARLAKGPTDQEILYATAELMDDYRNRFEEEQGKSWEEFVRSGQADLDQIRRQLTVDAEKALRDGMALDAFADRIGLMLNQREILTSVGEETQDESGARAILTIMMMTGQLPQICAMARRYKASDVVARKALNAAEARMVAEQQAGQAEGEAEAAGAAGAAGQRMSPFGGGPAGE